MAALRRIEPQVCFGGNRRIVCEVAAVDRGVEQLPLHVVRAGAFQRATALQRQREIRQLSLNPRSREQCAAAEVAERVRRGQEAGVEMRSRLTDVLRARKAQVYREEVALRVAAVTPELRELQQRCAAEHVTQERVLQSLERQVLEEQQHQATQQKLEDAELVSCQQAELDFESAVAQRVEGEEHRQALLAQISQQNASREEQAREERIADSTRAQGLAARVRADDAESLEHQRACKAEMCEALDRLCIARKAERVREAEREADTVLSAHAHVQDLDERARQWEAERRAAGEARDEVLKAVGMLVQRLNNEARGAEDLRIALACEERELCQQAREEAILAQHFAKRAAAVDAMTKALRNIEERRAADREAEAAWRVEFMDRLAEDDRLEQFGVQRRRALLVAHRQQVERLIADRRLVRTAERDAEEREAEGRRAEELRELHVVEKERHQLLEKYSHAEPLRRILLAEAKSRQKQDSGMYLG